jgi:PIN domain nuclease of toxin-antitoxin system
VARYLIDSHIFFWAIESPMRLSKGETAVLTDPTTDVVVSVASIWELSIKTALGRLALPSARRKIPPDHFTRLAGLNGIPIIGIEPADAEYVRELPQLHRDPFDRILIAQSLLGGRMMITRDAIFARYPGVRIFVS